MRKEFSHQLLEFSLTYKKWDCRLIKGYSGYGSNLFDQNERRLVCGWPTSPAPVADLQPAAQPRLGLDPVNRGTGDRSVQ